MTTTFRRSGYCHVFGDDIPLDDGLIPFDMAIRRVDDPAVLRPALLRMVDPDFPDRVRPGDIIVAGARFGCGKPHFQGFVAMASLGLSILCVSMPYKALRGAISKGVPVLTGLPAIGEAFRTGDRIEVDFVQGTIANLDNARRFEVPPLSPLLADMVRRGGTRGMLATWLEAHPEMRQPIDVPESQTARPQATPEAQAHWKL
ncbi:hypothetical protein CDO44_06245 [Pigmentiphaga sp. NML080357]|uniref:hypothetical protein n=1 Tax=Pigmentiphaga sp. NML080357 TaxID=2008675 RepID=UPI000B41CCFE|nr:hypothetical protein [Pigmentiphaga sp. NML080357]OVZ61241.1 hypothetical protein CDO44_06245 [Pigmentiphaga sp. NML080357]